ncbi:MAG: hypothetical protein ACI8ZM_000807 [Crocinitomix sp.]|jgi:hypothetical protein
MRLLFIYFLFASVTAFSAKDSLKFHAFLDGQIMVQTGNLKQFGSNLILNARISNSKFEFSTNASYQYVKVNDFNVINDFWSYGIFKYHHRKRVYPLIMTYYGFAKSFGIKYSFLSGLGGGINIVQKSPKNFLHANIIVGYMNFDYSLSQRQSGLVLNTFIQANATMFKEYLNIYWEAHAFRALNDSQSYGIQNQIRLGVPITKWLEIGISNTVNYNQTVDLGKQKLNSMTLAGIKLMLL